MAETKLVSLRVPVELWAWAGSYAKQRGTTKTALVESALRELRGLAEGGVPDVPTIAEELEAPHIGSVREMQPATARPVYDPSWTMDRQAKLNEAKYGRKR